MTRFVNRMGAVASLLSIGVLCVGACAPSDDMGGEHAESVPAPSSEPGVQPKGTEQHVQREGVVGVIREAVALTGFFRPDKAVYHPSKPVMVPGDPPWYPAPAERSTHSPGAMLEPEAWVDPNQVVPLMTAVDEGGARLLGALSARLVIHPDGRLSTHWVGASDGKVAIRAGKKEKGKRMTLYAVEAESPDSMEFVLAGLPPPQAGSMVLEYSEYLDPDVALQVKLTIEGGGVIAVERKQDGSLVLAPGVVLE